MRKPNIEEEMKGNNCVKTKGEARRCIEGVNLHIALVNALVGEEFMAIISVCKYSGHAA